MSSSSGELVWDFAIESLFKGVGDRFTPELRAKVKAAGIDADAKLLPAYTKDVWVRVVEVVATGVGHSHRELGAAITHGFAGTAMGIVMKPAVVLMGVRRVLNRLPRFLSMSNNFLKVQVHEAGAAALRVEVSHAVPSADFLAGCIEEMARYAGAKECQATPRTDGTQLVIDVTWR
jgi:uncharacterized protein (TIGR02265 family)